jgi:glycosyltransferase involved in cell wall biosynthesis
VLESAALLYPSGDSEALRVRMERLLGDEGLRHALINEGRTLAESLTWDRCASATAAVYREVLSGHAA